MSRVFTRAEVESLNNKQSLLLIIDAKVYDVTEFVDAHPGGEFVLLQVGGQDATTDFYNLHRQSVLDQYSELCVGTIANEQPSVITKFPGQLSLVPYAEPAWLLPQFKSPYYNDSHRRLQKAMRVFTETHILPEAQEKEVSGERISEGLIKKMAYVDVSKMWS